MRVKVANSVRNRLRRINRRYLRKTNEDVAALMNARLLAAISMLKTRRYYHRFNEELPDCYRVNVKPYVIYYYRNKEQEYPCVLPTAWSSTANDAPYPQGFDYQSRA